MKRIVLMLLGVGAGVIASAGPEVEGMSASGYTPQPMMTMLPGGSAVLLTLPSVRHAVSGARPFALSSPVVPT